MAAQTKPVIVLVNGAAHAPESWDLLEEALHGLGYETSTGKSPTVAPIDAHTVTLDDDVEEARTRIVKILDGENKNVLVVMHSYGGTVGSEAVKGLCIDERGGKAGVVGLVYLAAFLCNEGSSTADLSNADPEDAAKNLELANVDWEKQLIWFVEPEKFFYHDHTPERAAKYKALLQPYSAGGVLGKAKYAAFSRNIWRARCRYIICKNDRTSSLKMQHRMIKEAGDMKIAATLDTGHIPQTVIPDKLAQILTKVAQELA